MLMITIEKKELVELEASIKEKDKVIKQLQLDVEILTGLNYHNGALLVKSTLDNAKTLRDVYLRSGSDEGHAKTPHFRAGSLIHREGVTPPAPPTFATTGAGYSKERARILMSV